MRQLSYFSDLFDNLMADNFNAYNGVNRSSYYSKPALNIMEDEDKFSIEYAVPGMTKEDVEVKLDEDQRLMVSVGKKEVMKQSNEENAENSTEIAEKKTTNVRYIRREFSELNFTQKFNLPEDVDLDKISASMENGLLQVIIPKRTEEEKAKLQRTIAIG